MNRLDGQVVLVTGAASGLGRVLAQELGAAGCRLALLDADAERLAALADGLRDSGVEVRSAPCDIAELDQVAAAVVEVERAFGHVDVLVNNAGIWTDDEIERRAPERRRHAFLVNALGPIQVTDAVLPLLRRSTGTPQVVNVISASGATGTEAADNRRWSTYGATKSALAGYTRTLTAQLNPEGIKVSGVFPGGFESDMYEAAGSADERHDAFWMMRTSDVVDVLLFVLTRPRDVQVEQLLVTKRFDPPAT